METSSLLPLPNLELGRVSRIGLVMLVAGMGVAMFSAYMLNSSVQQARKIGLLVDQTNILRHELSVDHEWQVRHHVMLEHLERIVRASVLRKEALIRGIVKRRYGWTDEDVNSAIESEIGHVPEDDDVIFGHKPPLTLPSPSQPSSPDGAGHEPPH